MHIYGNYFDVTPFHVQIIDDHIYGTVEFLMVKITRFTVRVNRLRRNN